MSGCLPAGQGQMGRLPLSPSLSLSLPLSLSPSAVLETKLTQTCVNSWEKHPSLCFVKVIKITPRRLPLWVTP